MAQTQVGSNQIKDGGVKRADMNITTSGSAVITKAIGGSGIGISQTGVDNGTGDVTFSIASGYNLTVVSDVESIGSSLVINDDVADTLISATANPGDAGAQWSIDMSTITFPTDSSVIQWMLSMTFGGQNTTGVATTINFGISKNGSTIGGSSNIATSTGTSTCWRGKALVAPVISTDVVKLRLWASNANVVDLRAVVCYLVPYLLIPQGNKEYCSAEGVSLQGSITGATFLGSSTNSDYTYAVYDSEAARAIGSAAGVTTYGHTLLKGQGLICTQAQGQQAIATNSTLALYWLRIPNRFRTNTFTT